MQTGDDVAIRIMTRADLDVVVEWAAREGWNPGLTDADCFYAADPDGFLMGCLGTDPIGCISTVRYPGRFGFLGFYIVVPEMRGRGYGLQLWQAGMERLDGYTIGLDGVVDQQGNYSRSGFALVHRNIRFGGNPVCAEPKDPRLRPIHSEVVPALLRYDRSFFPAPREAFLRCWLEPQRRRGLAFVDQGTILGYGVVRPCRVGSKIGPLFADAEDIADLLFRTLVATAEDGPVYLDCPEPNRAATDLAARYGLSPVFETARMYRGPTPDLPLSKIYGITTYELG
jgi:GNAT superfamily N-acetyltransferase